MSAAGLPKLRPPSLFGLACPPDSTTRSLADTRRSLSTLWLTGGRLRGAPRAPERYSDEWREHCRAAGVPDVTLHASRHSSVSAMRAAGVNDQLTAAWHGHSERVMAEIYSHTTTAELVGAGAALEAATQVETSAGAQSG